LGQVERRGLTIKVVEMPGASTQTQIAWARPYDDSPDTIEKRRRDNVEALGLAVLNRRLNRLAQSPKPPFLEAQAGFQNVFRSVKVAIVEASSAPADWPSALGAIDQEVRRIVMFGTGQDELDREIAQARAALLNAVAGADTRPTPELAAGLVDGVDNDEVFTSPVEDLRLFDESVKGLTVREVDTALRAVFAGSGPLVELATPLPVTESSVTAEFARAQAAPLAAPAAQGALTWPYSKFGPAGKVVQRAEIADMGATTVRFANGVGLIVKPTAFRKDQILVAVNVGGGRLQLPLDHDSAAWATSALIDGGFKAISLEDTQRVLTGKIYGASVSVGDSAFELRGATRPQDLATQLQVLTAYVAEPGFRPEAFDRIRSAYLTALPQLAATPDGVLNRDLDGLLRSGDPRWRTPDAAQLAAAKPGDLSGLLSGILASGPIEITLVGDITVDQAIAEVARTFGALPSRSAAFEPPKAALDVRFPAPTASPVTRIDTGRADQAMALVAWPLTDFFVNMAQSRATMLAGEVLQNRVLDEVRIAQGATYSPETRVSLSETFPDYGVALTSVEMPPAKIPGFFADVARLAGAMRDTGVTSDELDRARNPRVAGIRKAVLTNEYWLSRLAGALSDPRRLELIRTTFPDYEKVTPADIQAAAKQWFIDDKAWKIVVSAAK
jgi:zinc protease